MTRRRLPWNLLDLAEREAIWDDLLSRLRRLGARRLLAELGCQGIAVWLDGGRLVMQGDFDDKHLWLVGYYSAEVAELMRQSPLLGQVVSDAPRAAAQGVGLGNGTPGAANDKEAVA